MGAVSLESLRCRFLVIRSIYGGPALYDRETGLVAPFLNDLWLSRALLSCEGGGRDRFMWRPAHEGEAR